MIPFLAPIFMAAPAVVTVADDADAAAYFAVLATAPSAAERARVNAVAKGLKDAGVWAGMDWFVLMAAETAQAARVNLRKPSKALSATNAPVFQPNVGWVGDGVSAYLDFGETFQATGNAFALANHTLGAAVTAQSSAVGPKAIVGNFTNNPRTTFSASSYGQTAFRSADASDGTFNTNATRIGHHAFSRNSTSTKRGFFNGVKGVEVASGASSLNATNATTHHSQGPYTDDTIGLVYSGAGFTDAQMAAIHTVVNNYLSPKGISL